MADNRVIFINNSTGELDWIAPYIKWSASPQMRYYIVFNFAKNRKTREEIFNNYFDSENQHIQYIESINFPIFFAHIDRIVDGLLRRISGIHYGVFLTIRRFVDLARKFAGMVFAKRHAFIAEAAKQDIIIFRDYNLKDSFALSAIIYRCNDPLVVVYPHSTAIQSNSKQTPKNPPKSVKCDLFLENTVLSNHFSDTYKSQFCAVGAPVFDLRRLGASFNVNAKTVLFLTRNCDPRYFGFTQKDALDVFKRSCDWAYSNGLRLIAKHHPRDPDLDDWRSIQRDYTNVSEFRGSLNDLSDDFLCVLSFYTSAGLLFTCRSIPVFDVSPYTGDVDNLPFHYKDRYGMITHDLIDKGFYSRSSIDSLESDVSILEEIGSQQRKVLDKFFPQGSCTLIDDACRQLIVRQK